MLKNGIWLFIITVVAFLIFLPVYTQVQDLRQRNQNYGNEIEKLKEEQVALKEEVRRLVEDPIYLEKIARERMGLVREGEVIYRIVPPEDISQ